MRTSPRVFFFTIASLFALVFSISGSANVPVTPEQMSTQSYVYPNDRSGIPQSYIFDSVQDEHGFLWFASSEGLVRFDGYNTKIFYSDSQDVQTLPANFVRRVFIDTNGALWVATIDGLALFDRNTETFKRFGLKDVGETRFDILKIIETADGELVVSSTEQLYRVDRDNGVLVEYNPNVRFPRNIMALYDEPSRIWIGTQGFGGYMYDKRTKQIFSLSGINPWSLSIDVRDLNDVKAIDGEYWLATDEGLFRISQSESFAADNVVLSGKQVKQIQSHQESIFVVTNSDVIELSKPADSSDYSTRTIHQGLDGLFSLFIDNNATHWLGTDNGVKTKTHVLSNLPLIGSRIKSDPEGSGSRRLESMDIWGIDEDSNGDIWSISQSGELQRYTLTTGGISRFQIEEDIELWDLAVDSLDRLWIATGQGLKVYTLQNNSLELIDTPVSDIPVYDIVFADNKIWFWTPDSRFYYIETNAAPLAISQLKIGLDLLQPRIVSVDSQKRLWISGRGKTLVYDFVRQRFVETPSFFKSLRSLIDVFEANGFLWLLTHDRGIIQLESNAFSVIQSYAFDQKGDAVFSGLANDNGFWFASGNRIQFFDIEAFDITQIIKPSQLNFNKLYEGVALKTKSGLYAFGGKYGYNLFSPEMVSNNGETQKQTEKPLISEFILNAEKMPFTDIRSPLTLPVYLEQILNLKFTDDRFTFAFALVNTATPLEVEYRYQLKGYDSDWTPTDDVLSRRAVFHNIPWGAYTLLVQAKEPNKRWSESTSLNIVIAPPPWFSKPALLLYCVFAVMVAFFLLRQYQQRRQTQQTIKESEERLKLTLWSSGDELWDWDILRGQIYRSNTWGILDFPQDDIRTNSAYQGNIHSADLVRVQDTLKAHIDGKTDYYEVSYRTKTFKNKWIWVLDRGKIVSRDHNKQALRMTGTLKNIQHLKEAEETLRLFERSIENISEGVFITDTTFRFISVNRAYCKFTGETEEQALASYLRFHQYPNAFTDEVKKALMQKHNWSGEIESRRVSGEQYEMKLNIDAVHDDDGKISHYVGVLSDITERKSTEKELLKLANTDSLTELPNRSFFQASQQNLVRRNEPHTLICLDMDNFKRINDSLGHQTGDVLIKQIAKRLQRITGKSATCYRLGGDEFSLLMEDSADVHMITHYAQNILDNLCRPFIINKQEFVLSASIGIAFYPNDGATPQELLKNADTAMYFAKNAGGNAYKFFSGEMNQNAVRQLQIENLIRQGLKDDLFNVFYQPKVNIASGQLVSMEALVRFEHPQKGIVSPGQFIPLAEQSGQIIDIGEIVLEKALRDTKKWVDAGLFNGRVAVNISAKQFELDDLDDRIQRILNKVGISAVHLECEITEGTLMENPDKALQMMHRLRNKGIHLALDDFGTGYSSLAYLKQFPLNTLKIDKAFIDDIAESSVDRHLAAAIINIAHNLNLHVVAEGVEHEEQLIVLRRYDCEMLQGFLYSKPLRPERFEKLLTENLELNQFLSKPTTSE